MTTPETAIEAVTVRDATGAVRVHELVQRVAAWCRQNGQPPVSSKTLRGIATGSPVVMWFTNTNQTARARAGGCSRSMQRGQTCVSGSPVHGPSRFPSTFLLAVQYPRCGVLLPFPVPRPAWNLIAGPTILRVPPQPAGLGPKAARPPPADAGAPQHHGAALHAGGRGGNADGQHPCAPLNHLKDGQGVEPRRGVIGKGEVPLTTGKRLRQPGDSRHALGGRGVAAAARTERVTLDAALAAAAAANATSPSPPHAERESMTCTRSARSPSWSRVCWAAATVPDMPPARWMETMSLPCSSSGSYTAKKSPIEGCEVVGSSASAPRRVKYAV